MIASAAVSDSEAAALKSELMIMSFPAPVAAMAMFGAVMVEAPAVVKSAPTEMLNSEPADEDPSVRPSASTMNTLLPVVLAVNVFTSVCISAPAAPMLPAAERLSVSPVIVKAPPLAIAPAVEVRVIVPPALIVPVVRLPEVWV